MMDERQDEDCDRDDDDDDDEGLVVYLKCHDPRRKMWKRKNMLRVVFVCDM